MFLQTINRKCLNLGIAAVAMFAAIPAYATVVDYSTTGVFTCAGCTLLNGGSEAVFGSGANTATLVFTGVNTTVNSPGGFVTAGYGTITAMSAGSGAMINGTFTLGVNQSAPPASPSMGAFPTATLSGMVFDGSSTSYASFGNTSDPTITINSETYELDTSKNLNHPTQFGYTIISPDTGTPPGQTSLQGNINSAPEPTFLTLTGTGFMGLAAIALRRRRQNA